MAKTIIVILALSVFVAHCHVLKDKEPVPLNQEHKREKRPCYVCDNVPPGPPPPHRGLPPSDSSSSQSGAAEEKVSGDAGLGVPGGAGVVAGTGQDAFSVVFNLAVQGLQAALQSSGCSTCGKRSYALSNANSQTGKAESVSIGG